MSMPIDSHQSFVGEMVGFVALGWLLDKSFGTGRKCLVGFGVAGVVFSLFHLLRTLLRMQEREREERRKSRTGSSPPASESSPRS